MKAKETLLAAMAAISIGLPAFTDIKETLWERPEYPKDSHHWDYQHADAWANLCQEFKQCAEGNHQSPIDIETVELKEVPGSGLGFRYHASLVDVQNNGHTIEVDIEEPNSLELSGKSFQLKQFHFHEPSEHRLDGVLFPMEMHLVHADTAGHLAVIGIFIKEGHPNEALDEIWRQMPTHPHEHVHAPHALDLAKLFPEGHSFFHYEGSLTTPPCTEGVQWFVLKEPLTLSKQQIETFRRLYHGNNRPVQAANHRAVEVVSE
ncbi:MAG: carbonic anhydrase family protein [Saprospiraceae bacterium]|nr:carbonic anhydrase family protein [Saprospiraceae bacterium]